MVCHIAAAVGTVAVRSLIEPIRKIIARLRGHFIEGKAVDLCMSQRLVEVETLSATGQSQNIYVPCALPSSNALHPTSSHCSIIRYDKLVIAVGSSSATHGVPGLQHSFQLKTVQDAQAIRRRIMGNS